jgi:hypothetical protein
VQELCWSPDHALADKQIDHFLVIARSVGTFARYYQKPMNKHNAFAV